MHYFYKFLELFFLVFFGLFPVKKRRVFLMSYYGKHVNCNPYALYCQMKQTNKYEFVWVDNKGYTKEKTVKYRSIPFYYYLRTSGILIFNARPNVDIKKRKKQIYIQTWHSSLGFKKIERDAEKTLDPRYVKKAKKDSRYIDLLISGCHFRTECFRRNFWYDGKIMEVGTPRNDIFFSDNASLVVKVKQDLGIRDDEKILMYAPTFRSDGSLEYAMHFPHQRLAKALTDRFGQTWRIVVRLHPNISVENVFEEQIVDASHYPDMQALLIATDVLVTDYSSVMFDFILQKRPCLLYCPDYEKYVETERDTYFSLKDLPFPISFNQESLIDCIHQFNENEYQKALLSFGQQIGNFEKGEASQKIIEWIEDKLEK